MTKRFEPEQRVSLAVPPIWPDPTPIGTTGTVTYGFFTGIEVRWDGESKSRIYDRDCLAPLAADAPPVPIQLRKRGRVTQISEEARV